MRQLARAPGKPSPERSQTLSTRVLLRPKAYTAGRHATTAMETDLLQLATSTRVPRWRHRAGALPAYQMHHPVPLRARACGRPSPERIRTFCMPRTNVKPHVASQRGHNAKLLARLRSSVIGATDSPQLPASSFWTCSSRHGGGPTCSKGVRVAAPCHMMHKQLSISASSWGRRPTCSADTPMAAACDMQARCMRRQRQRPGAIARAVGETYLQDQRGT